MASECKQQEKEREERWVEDERQKKRRSGRKTDKDVILREHYNDYVLERTYKRYYDYFRQRGKTSTRSPIRFYSCEND